MILMRKEKVVPYLFLIPAFLGLSIFRLAPIITSIFDSFTTVGFANGMIRKFCGLKNYLFVLTDPVFLKSLKNTLVFTLIVNPFQILWAFILALLVYKEGKGMGVFRTVFFIPFTLSLAITATIWGIMFNPNGGFINSILGLLRLKPMLFLTSSSQALGSIIFLVSWRCVGYWMIFLISGLQNISQNLYESAWIDGARAWQSFLYITMPMMKRTFLFVIVADTTQNFLMFTPMYILTGGGPENATNVAMYEAYKNVFIYADRGVGNAMVIIIILMILTVVFCEFKFIHSKER
ncbi:sugar ABC transporter permease [Treponema sp. HNW]|uniref:carbohydrate ABC transporter permease n=1 Tax=Treponema sp. HNW TaxID=3116654 RepID=UPI003D131BAE